MIDGKALGLCMSKAQQGDSDAQVALGSYFFTEVGNYKAAANWFRKAAEQGNADGQFGLSGCYMMGLGVELDFSEGLKWARRAAAMGHKQAISYLEMNGWR